MPTDAASMNDFLDCEFAAIAGLVRRHAALAPQRPALVLGDQNLDYAGLDARMDQVAAALQRARLPPRNQATQSNVVCVRHPLTGKAKQ